MEILHIKGENDYVEFEIKYKVTDTGVNFHIYIVDEWHEKNKPSSLTSALEGTLKFDDTLEFERDSLSTYFSDVSQFYKLMYCIEAIRNIKEKHFNYDQI